MKLEDKIKDYKEQTHSASCENKIQDTIRKSKDTFYQAEQGRLLSYREFLQTQVRLIQKRWWMLQAALLALAVWSIPKMDHSYFVQRSLGVAGVLFIVLIIPEIWKNQVNCCMEIEAAAYYSLRQIYAARILLFGIVDVFLLTVFVFVLHGKLRLGFLEVLTQFLFPTAVTACICFGLLCHKRMIHEAVSILLCLAWSAIWWLITLSEKLYTAVIAPVWAVLFGAAVLFLACLIYKTLCKCRRCWEVQSDGNKDA